CVLFCFLCVFFFFSSRRRHTRFSRDWSSDVCSSDLGKSMTAHAVMGLLPRPHVRVTGGEIAYRGRDILTMGGAEQRGLRGGRIRSEERRVGKECRSRGSPGT